MFDDEDELEDVSFSFQAITDIFGITGGYQNLVILVVFATVQRGIGLF